MLEIRMTPISSLSYQGTAIRLRGAMLNLTDMWQAAGRPDNRRPSDWLLLEETRRFRAYAGTHWTEVDDPVRANAGLAGIGHLDTMASSPPSAATREAPGRIGSSRWPTPATSRRRSTSGATPSSAPPSSGGTALRPRAMTRCWRT